MTRLDWEKAKHWRPPERDLRSETLERRADEILRNTPEPGLNAVPRATKRYGIEWLDEWLDDYYA
jgi:hypothetical protein